MLATDDFAAAPTIPSGQSTLDLHYSILLPYTTLGVGRQ